MSGTEGWLRFVLTRTFTLACPSFGHFVNFEFPEEIMFVYDPYGIAREIAKRAALIEQLNWEIEELRQSQIFDVEDNTDYTD
ncbi:hypothetical protein IXB50_05405 [Leptothoe spongobia TAU-MAC 1115]|uniref:Uncharacterized protein n=1 Tax=Leptothoe spongobia TAU-MAC 1115 TaxID=1967444 RepID=A0A947DDG9_9CYAN|nr:hypothetical protein [Leptothoe spongobia TAU-MAC 1115]